jgi:hypothetical protein
VRLGAYSWREGVKYVIPSFFSIEVFPHCRGQLNAHDNQAGQTIECPLCHKYLVPHGVTSNAGSPVMVAVIMLSVIFAICWGFVKWDGRQSNRQTKPAPPPREKTAQDIQAELGVPRDLRNSLYDGSVPAVEDYLREKYAEYKVLKWRPTAVKDGKCFALCDVSVKNKLGGWSNYGMVFAATMSGQIIEVVPMPLN